MRRIFAALAVVSALLWGIVVVQGAESPSWLGSSALLATGLALGFAALGLRGMGRRVGRLAGAGTGWPGAQPIRNEARTHPFLVGGVLLAMLAVVAGRWGPGSLAARVLSPLAMAFHLGALGLAWISLAAQGRLLAESRDWVGFGSGGERR